MFTSWFKRKADEVESGILEVPGVPGVPGISESRGVYFYLDLRGKLYLIPQGTAYTNEVLDALRDIVVIYSLKNRESAIELDEDNCRGLVEMHRALRAVKDTGITFRRDFIYQLLEYSIFYNETSTCSFEKALRTVIWAGPTYEDMERFEFYIQNSEEIDSFFYQCYLAYSTYGITNRVDINIKAPKDFLLYTYTDRVYKDLFEAMYRAGSPRYLYILDAPLLLILATSQHLNFIEGSWHNPNVINQLTDELKSNSIQLLYKR